jgi:hypothetical protein
MTSTLPFAIVSLLGLAALNFILRLRRSPHTASLAASLGAIVTLEIVVVFAIRHGVERPAWLTKTRLAIATAVIAALTLIVPPLWFAGYRNDLLRLHAYAGNMTALKVLLALGADVNDQGAHHETALMFAAGGGACNAVALLLDHGANMNLRDEVGRSALAYAVALKHEDCGRVLLTHAPAGQQPY